MSNESALLFFEFINVVSSLENTLNFLSINRLIIPFNEAPNCVFVRNGVACEQVMKLGGITRLTDKIRWKCSRKDCNGTKSIRYGSIFKESNLPIQSLLAIMWHWCMGDSYTLISTKFGLSEHTIVNWANIFREVCCADLITMDLRIGGPGVIVEMDESNLNKKPKHNIGSAWHMNEQWVWGAVERNNSSKFVAMFLPHHLNTNGILIADRRRSAILPQILKWIKPGSVIYSDMCSAYWVNTGETLTNLENIQEVLDYVDPMTGEVGKNYTHRAVNHSLNFVDWQNPEVHTQTIEVCWGSKLKHQFKSMKGVSRELIPSYVDMAMWKSWKISQYEPFERPHKFFREFIEAIKNKYIL
jgi:hypothetical protein